MNKYIDADKLKAEIERLHKAHSGKYGCDEVGLNLEYLEDFIDSLQQEQPEMDLEKEIEKQIRSIFYDLEGIAIMGTSKYASVEDMVYIARHFYELRNRALEESAQHVYESWMGGTMDDVRRDMVELGKVLNARNEE